MATKRKRGPKGRFVKTAKRRTRKHVARRVSAPKRRRRTAKRRSPVTRLRRHAVYQTNPRRKRSHRRYHRNPGIGGLSMHGIMPTLKEGAMIALGAVAVGNAMAYIPYVSTLTGTTRHAARLGVAVLGGALIAKYFNRDLGKAFAMGGVVATALQLAQENFPTLVPLSSMDEMALGMYYAQPKALGEYYAAGPTVGLQPDGLGFETDLPDRLSQNRF